MNYTFLKSEDLPESLRGKPKWMSCLILAAGLLFLTLSAVSVGAIFGYTYCYIEHRGMKYGADNFTQPKGLPDTSYLDTEGARYNRTLSGALMSSTFITKLKMIGTSLLDDSAGRRRRLDLNNTVTK